MQNYKTFATSCKLAVASTGSGISSGLVQAGAANAKVTAGQVFGAIFSLSAEKIARNVASGTDSVTPKADIESLGKLSDGLNQFSKSVAGANHLSHKDVFSGDDCPGCDKKGSVRGQTRKNDLKNIEQNKGGGLISDITGQKRHNNGPDAYVLSLGGEASGGVGSSGNIGTIYITRGNDKGFHFYGDIGVGGGGLHASIAVEVQELYYTGSLKTMTKDVFGKVRIQSTFSADFLGHFGVSSGVSKADFGKVYSFGGSLGVGVSPHIIQSTTTGGYTIIGNGK